MHNEHFLTLFTVSYAAAPAIAAPVATYGHGSYGLGLGHAYAAPLATSYAAAPALAHSYGAPVAAYGLGHASYGLGNAYGYGAHSYAAPLAHGW